jgi:hypothetical protein
MAPMRFDPRCHLVKGSRRSLLSKANLLLLQARRRLVRAAAAALALSDLHAVPVDRLLLGKLGHAGQ